MQLIRKSQDRTTLATELFTHFKEHLRILHNHEDDSIMLYLVSALDAIATYGGNDVFLAEYDVFYPRGGYEYKSPSDMYGWFCGKYDISDLTVINSAGIDKTADYTIDAQFGVVYPHPLDNKINFKAGYLGVDDMPPRLVNIVFRLGADYMENRESTRVGEPKLLPDWIKYSLASIWKPRV